MNKAKVDEALSKFRAALPEPPEWIILITYNGEFISRVGEYPTMPHLAIDDVTATLATHTHGMHLLTTLDHLKQGNLQYSMTFGSQRTFFLFQLNDAFFLGLAYNGVKSFDAIIEAVLLNFYDILEAVNPSQST